MATLKGKNVLVTGGAGFIGSHLVDRLIAEQPAKLVIVDNFFLGNENNLRAVLGRTPDVYLHRLDVASLASMQQLVRTEKIEVVFDLAVIPLPTSLQHPVWTVEVNTGIALTFCELARWGEIGTLIHLSSSEAYGSAQFVPMNEKHPLAAITPYAASKAACDQIVLSYCHTFGINAVILRPFNNYGPRQNAKSYAGIIPIVVNRIDDGVPIEVFGDGMQTRDFIFVRNTAEAIVRVFNSEITRGQVINVASGRETSVNELVERLKFVMNAPSHPVVYRAPRPGDVRRHCGDVSLLHELTDFEPPAMSDADLQETVEWYRENRK